MATHRTTWGTAIDLPAAMQMQTYRSKKAKGAKLVVLKDIQCRDCGRVRDMMLDGAETWVVTNCTYCRRDTHHDTICNGGTGKRFRYNDWDGVTFRGQVEALPPTAEAADPDTGKMGPLRHGTTGKIMHEDPRFHGDHRKERRDRVYHADDKKHGRTPLYFDQRARG